MFLLTCKNEFTGEINSYLYNREKKSLFCIETKQYLEYPKPITTTLHRSKFLHILLGAKCNLACNYCIQSFRNAIPDFSPKQVDEFLAKLTATINLKEYERIYIWGGEPLVYRKTIQKLIPKLVKLKSDSCSIQTATNATILTEDDLKFFLKYNVRVMVSDDAFNHNRFVNEQIPIELINKYRLLGFNYNIHSTITPNNADISKIYAKLVEKYGEDVEFSYSVAFIPMDRYEDPLFTWNEDSLKILEESYIKLLNNNKINDHESHTTANLQKVFKRSCQTYSCRFGEGGGLAVDVNGDLYQCNCVFSPERRLGNLKDYPYGLVPNNPNLQNKRKKIFISVEDRSECADCLYKYICFGKCSSTSGTGFLKLCTAAKVCWNVVFKTALLKKFGLTLLSYRKL